MQRLIAIHRIDYHNPDPEEVEVNHHCVFCQNQHKSMPDHQSLILKRYQRCFLMVNHFPYNIGHLLLVSNRHIGALEELHDDELSEMTKIMKKASLVLNKVYKPHGMNIGINIGVAGGASLPQHLHFHIVPRWQQDSSFMLSISETKVFSEAPVQTYQKLHAEFGEEL